MGVVVELEEALDYQGKGGYFLVFFSLGTVAIASTSLQYAWMMYDVLNMLGRNW